MDEYQNTGSLELTFEQLGYLYDIMVDHQAMIHGTKAYGEAAEQELDRMILAAENEESKEAAEKGKEALAKDKELIEVASNRFLEIYNIVIPYVENLKLRGNEELPVGTEEPVHSVGENTEDVQQDTASDVLTDSES